MALTRLVEIQSGKIEIDQIDISQIELRTLRDKITVIPQDPTLFTGSLKYNIDPLGLESDETIEELVRKAGLENISTKSKGKPAQGMRRQRNKVEQEQDEQDQNGIYFQIRENGSNLSVGER